MAIENLLSHSMCVTDTYNPLYTKLSDKCDDSDPHIVIIP